MAAAIQQAKGVLPTLIKGKDGVFDVSVDGRLIYSKDQTGRFPEPAEILARLP